MSFPFPVPHRRDPRWTREGGVHVRRGEGTARRLAGDTYTIKATADDTDGALGFATAVVPPGGGPVAHAHDDAEEAFYLLDGELEFLLGARTFTVTGGDFVFVPRNTRHRFKNVGDRDATFLFMFTPGGQERFFIDHGDEPVEGETSPPWGAERYAALADALLAQNVTLLPED
ncbi:cupin domain-containing protein [Streptomyces sp. H28]|uniref:cupin domain-containing protein n=1 Tax=Streptomyces sp. H28 TaxID=2775865 RepID=UPI001783A7E0|nr:cupin domain-containing protein [Streptomyces sp. H28]MBD9733868.1 cupin domain-containing protein [Streptomyces sp. H28]